MMRLLTGVGLVELLDLIRITLDLLVVHILTLIVQLMHRCTTWQLRVVDLLTGQC